MSLHILHPSGYSARYFVTFAGPTNKPVWAAEYIDRDGEVLHRGDVQTTRGVLPGKAENRAKAEKLVRSGLDELIQLEARRAARGGGKKRHSKVTSSKPPHQMTPEKLKYLDEVKDRARRSRQIICTELPDGTYWGADQFGHTLYAKNSDVCVSKLVSKSNQWLKTHPKDALRAQVDELNDLLKE